MTTTTELRSIPTRPGRTALIRAAGAAAAATAAGLGLALGFGVLSHRDRAVDRAVPVGG